MDAMAHAARRLSLRSTRAPLRTRRPLVTAAPIVKWVGGKSKLLAELQRWVPRRYGRYFEPFAGGAAMFFHLAPAKAVLCDTNGDLIHMYRTIASQTSAVIEQLEEHREQHSRDHFYAVRDRWNARLSTETDDWRAATFIYLNKTCYNGLWRVNRNGGFNVPMGSYRNPRIFDAAQLRAAATVLRGAELRGQSFVDGVADAGPGDLVYFDPPYHPVSATANFTSYTAESFGCEQQRQLAALARRLNDRGCTVIASNSDTPFIRELYAEFRIEVVHCARAINSNAAKRGPVREVVITNG